MGDSNKPDELLERFDSLSLERRALLALQALRLKNGNSARQTLRIPKLPRNERQNSFVASSAQQRLWFLSQMDDESAVYNLPFSARLLGRLDIAAMERSLNEIIRRHESLRTTFAVVDGRVLQVIAPEARIELPVINLQAHPDQYAEVSRLAAECAWEPFDLSHGPLLRGMFFKLGEEEHVMIFTMHHIVSDAWSIGVLIKEVTLLYEAFSGGRLAPLPELTVQYADYSAWHREWMEGDGFKAQMEYWKRKLEGALPLLEMPSDRARQTAQTLRGATYQCTLSEDLVAEIKRLGRREDVTLFMTLAAAFKVLLYRYTRQTDVIVGTPTAGRVHGDIEGLIGFFVNTLVLRTDLAGNPTCRELLTRLRHTAVEAYANEGVPFEKIVEEVRPERQLNRNPLFPTMIALQNTPTENLQLHGLTLTPFDAVTRTQTFDELYLSIFEAERGFIASVEYKTDLFDETTISRIMGHYTRLLEGIAGGDDTCIDLLPLLTDAEMRQMTDEWNQTAREFPLQNCVHEFFEAQAARIPDAVAVVCGGELLTYQCLNQRANRLARYLTGYGIGPESRVAILISRSMEMAVGVMAILKAGGAYVPFDPSYPQERLEFVLEDAGAKLLLTQSKLSASLPNCRANILCLDSDWDLVSQSAAPGFDGASTVGNLDLQATADNTAYVIYTSGLTGRPKGVLMTHRPLVNLIKWHSEHHKGREGTRALQFAAFPFDVSFQEMFSTWAVGGALLFVDESLRRDITALVHWLNERGIDRLFLTFTALQQVAKAVVDQQPPLSLTLSEVITAGEQLQITSEVADLFGRLPECSLYNQYGPTETHVVTAADLGNQPGLWPRLPSIGRQIPHTEIYILDGHLQPVPVGVAGELYIGGICLSRGYLGKPALTADRYLPHPLVQKNGGRLYRTGDLARYLRSGEIEILGRLDYQVKVRGYRIELGEIEAALDEHPFVFKSLVTAREDVNGEKRLIAYWLGAADRNGTDERGGQTRKSDEKGSHQASDSLKLRRYLQSKLPDYMVPSAFINLQEWPLTSSGKINRSALPIPDLSRPELDKDFVPPQTSVEKALAEIWSQALRIDAVGRHDNLVELGGDSITSIQIISRARRLGLDLTVPQLWQRPTIAELAELVGEKALSGSRQSVASSDLRIHTSVENWAPPNLNQSVITRLASLNGEIEDAYPLSHMQMGILFHSLYSPGLGEYVEQFSCEISGSLNLSAFERAWECAFKRHPAMRTALVLDGVDEPLQVVYRKVTLPLARHDWREMPPPEQRRRLQDFWDSEEQTGEFQLDTAPLIRLTLFQLADDAYHFVWSFHDIILDGWSGPLILEEVSVMYEAFCRDQNPQIGAAYPYRNFIEWLNSQDLSKAEAFWRRTLEGGASPVEIDPDRTMRNRRPEKESYGIRWRQLSHEKTSSLQSFARRHQVTLNTLAQAAWALLLSRYSGESDVIFGSVVSGRPAEIEGSEAMAGMLVNTLPVRAQVPHDKSLMSWLKEIQSSQVEARQYEFSPLIEINKWGGLAPGKRMFESILAIVNYPEVRNSLWKNIVWSWQKSGYPLFITFRQGEELVLEITYRAGRFDGEDIELTLSHLQTVLERIVGDENQQVSQINILSDQERDQLIWGCNDTEQNLPLDMVFHQHFEMQVDRSPDAVACADGVDQLTYAELNLRADRLAVSLSQKGVGPDAIIALLGERNVAFLTAIMGVFKAGAAYLPLDPRHPHDHNRKILERSGASALIVTDLSFIEPAQSLGGVSDKPLEVLLIEEQVRHGGEQNPIQCEPNNLAYVIFTSGSTGLPKGAMIDHRGMLNHLFAKIQDLSLTAEDIVAQTASQCFDISVWQFLAVLLVGGKTQIVDDEQAHDPARQVEMINSQSVTIFEAVPSMLGMTLEEIYRRAGPRPAFSALRWMIPTGEALSPDLCRKWFSLFPRIPMMNAYGPTECSDDVTHYQIYRELEADAYLTPIGRAVVNMRLYTLDPRLEPSPINRIGELYVGGIGVGRGYLNDAERTSAVFIPDRFSQVPGARHYKTGDLARRLKTGDLEFFGRIDHQVKIRGCRIELGEIEVALAKHASVKECVVVAQENVGGQKDLVAYIAPQSDGLITSAELRNYIKERLPGYMVPASFILLDRIPLTSNGKIDRKALASLKVKEERSEDREREMSAVEEIIAGIWKEVLGLESVGLKEDFFVIGGHSLLATQVASRIRRAFKVELTLRTLFEKKTIAELAELVERQLHGSDKLESPPIVAAPREGKLPLSFAQQRLWFLDQLEPGNIAYNMPLAIRLSGKLKVNALMESLNEVIRRHEALRTKFVDDDGVTRQEILVELPVALPIVDLGEVVGEEGEETSRRIAKEIARRPFDLRLAPLLRGALIRLSAEEHLAVFTMHHIISDGWSLGVLEREIAALYDAYSAGRQSQLEELPFQYADYAVWERRWLEGEVLESQLSYWKRQLEGMVPMSYLPVDRPKPESQSFRGAFEKVQIDSELSSSLKRMSQAEGVTLFMLLLAAFQTLLHKYSRAPEIVVGSAIANRTHKEIEGLIGFFVNMLVFRIEFEDNPSFRELLRRVGRKALEAYDNQDVPFERVVEEIKPERDNKHQPLYHVIFALQNTPVNSVTFDNLVISEWMEFQGSAKVDLMLNMWEAEKGLRGYLEYNTDIYEAATIRRLVIRFERLLRNVVADPAARVSEIEVLSDEEKFLFGKSIDVKELDREFMF